MTIAAFPAALQPLIQQGYLERQFTSGLESTTVFRSIADLETFPANVGETITKTRMGLKAPITTPSTPANNTNLDNGMTPTTATLEQYTLGVNQYNDSIDLNVVTQGVGIARQFTNNARINGVQAAQSVDRLARGALFDAYMSGNTRVRTTLGAPGVAVAVDDIRGFLFVPVLGKLVAVSGTYTMQVVIGSSSYTLVGTVADGSNLSVTPGGVSGVLTFSGNVSVSDATALNAITSFYAPTVLRAGGRSTNAALTGVDMFTMGIALDAVTQLRNNAVPEVNGMYNCYLDNTSARQLFADPDFKLLFQGQNASSEFAKGKVIELLSLRFISTTEAIQQQLGSIKVHRPIVVGAGALVEGVYADVGFSNIPEAQAGLMSVSQGIAQVTRPPIDRLRQIVAQSWYYIGGFCVPTDVTANSSIIPTASNAMFKRAVMIEHA